LLIIDQRSDSIRYWFKPSSLLYIMDTLYLQNSRKVKRKQALAILQTQRDRQECNISVECDNVQTCNTVTEIC